MQPPEGFFREAVEHGGFAHLHRKLGSFVELHPSRGLTVALRIGALLGREEAGFEAYDPQHLSKTHEAWAEVDAILMHASEANSAEVHRLFKQARAWGVAPLAVCAERLEDRVAAYLRGADGVFGYEQSLLEVLLSVRALQRSTFPPRPVRNPTPGDGGRRVLERGVLRLDSAGYHVQLGGQELAVNARQFEILYLLTGRLGETASRAELLKQAWGIDFDPGTSRLDYQIHRLRAQMRARQARYCIESVRGQGFRLVPDT